MFPCLAKLDSVATYKMVRILAQTYPKTVDEII